MRQNTHQGRMVKITPSIFVVDSSQFKPTWIRTSNVKLEEFLVIEAYRSTLIINVFILPSHGSLSSLVSVCQHLPANYLCKLVYYECKGFSDGLFI